MAHPSNLCLINIGLYRTGSTTLAEAARELGAVVDRSFPILSEKEHQKFLEEPKSVVLEWFHSGGLEDILGRSTKHQLVCDGWVPLLCFLPTRELFQLQEMALEPPHNTRIKYIVTTRESKDIVRSELHHWVIHDLERTSGLDEIQRGQLEFNLHRRTIAHDEHLRAHRNQGLQFSELPLDGFNTWCKTLQDILPIYSGNQWREALLNSGKSNANPELPLEAILLTLRIEDCSISRVANVLDGLEKDSICRYMLVVAVDEDQTGQQAEVFIQALESRPRVEKLVWIVNPRCYAGTPFAICRSWAEMANRAFEEGADWMVLLGDDIEIHTPYHYRETLRTFLDIQKKTGLPFAFGCPYWNDLTFPGFPTFPVVGRQHWEIFRSFIPAHRFNSFVNQDLDPYLQRLYLKFGAAPPMIAALSNKNGGDMTAPARYQRVGAVGWKDWVLTDVEPINEFIASHSSETQPQPATIKLVDVVIPTYRLNIDFLSAICSLSVPENVRLTFLVIVDNPELLKKMTGEQVLGKAERALEKILQSIAAKNGQANNIRVRCNSQNSGASKTRNRGIDESAAEFILFLDDDVKPSPDLLHMYSIALDELQYDEVGLIGMVKFPRTKDLPWKHAAVLMSYLTFMFEIADKKQYQFPAWGVTANLLLKRSTIRFDTRYAKTGGGEDVDFCLRVSEETQGRLKSCPSALVFHDFWKGSVFQLGGHFFYWAIGDGALFLRFPEFTFSSWPNVIESCAILLPVQLAAQTPFCFVLATPILFFVVDCIADMTNKADLSHRCALLDHERSPGFLFLSHILANFYVNVLESGRFYGHVKRGQFENLCQRFDWHCGRLPNGPANFRRREYTKFLGFAFVGCVGWMASCWQSAAPVS